MNTLNTEKELTRAASSLVSSSDSWDLHMQVHFAVQNVLTEIACGYYPQSLAVEKLQSKVFFIKLNLGNN